MLGASVVVAVVLVSIVGAAVITASDAVVVLGASVVVAVVVVSADNWAIAVS